MDNFENAIQQNKKIENLVTKIKTDLNNKKSEPEGEK